MRISDLQKILRGAKRKHGDIELSETRYSDICLMEVGDWNVIDALPKVSGKDEGWLMRVHPSMTEEQKAQAKKYLHFAGN